MDLVNGIVDGNHSVINHNRINTTIGMTSPSERQVRDTHASGIVELIGRINRKHSGSSIGATTCIHHLNHELVLAFFEIRQSR